MLEHYLVAATYLSFRLAPITLVTPIFAFTYIPVFVRVMLTVVLSAIIALSLDAKQMESMPTTLSIAFIASEFFLGLLLSLGFHAASAAIHVVSQLIDAQIGFAAGATFDPVNYQTTSPLGTLFSLVLVATFFFTNLHYEFLLAFAELFRVAPPGILYSVDTHFFYAISAIFAAGFVIASPVIIVLWLVDASLAIVSRSLPQAQIYFVALPLKILIGLYVLAITLNSSQNTLYGILNSALGTWKYIDRL